MVVIGSLSDFRKFSSEFVKKLFSEEFQRIEEGIAREVETGVELVSGPKIEVKDLGDNSYQGMISLKFNLFENNDLPSSEEIADLISDYFERKYEDFYHRISNMLETFYVMTYDVETKVSGRKEKAEEEYLTEIKFSVKC